MNHNFNSEKLARDFFNKQTKDLLQIQTEVISNLSDEIIKQEHFSFFDFLSDTKHTISFYEKKNGFEVTINTRKYSQLVFAAEIGDLELFQVEMQRNQSTNTIALAIKYAILNEKLNILQFCYSKNIIKKISFFKNENPIVYAAKFDKINSFKFLVGQGEQLEVGVLENILYNNSILVLKYLIGDVHFSIEILQSSFRTNWVLRILKNSDNEAVKMFKFHLESHIK